MNKLQARYVSDIIAFAVLALIAALTITLGLLALAAWLSGCGGAPFQTIDNLTYAPESGKADTSRSEASDDSGDVKDAQTSDAQTSDAQTSDAQTSDAKLLTPNF